MNEKKPQPVTKPPEKKAPNPDPQRERAARQMEKNTIPPAKPPEDPIDEANWESFPASDPPAH